MYMIETAMHTKRVENVDGETQPHIRQEIQRPALLSLIHMSDVPAYMEPISFKGLC